MPLEVYGVKRKAKHAGEVGIFIDSPAWADDPVWIKTEMGTDLRLKITTARNLRQLAFAWVLAGKIAENCDGVYLDKDDAMDNVPYGLKCRAKHAKAVVDPVTGEVTVKPLSLKRLDGEAFKRLLDRMVYVTCTEIIPGLEVSVLRDELEAMVGGKRMKPTEKARDLIAKFEAKP
jgi:hypothetical protein